jgi:oligopeptide transport system permease protein
MLIFPSIALSLTLFSLNFLGDGMRDAFDPQSSKD